MKRSRILTGGLALILVFLLSACDTVAPTASQKSVDLPTLQASMLEAAPSLPDMISVTGGLPDSKRAFSYLSDFPYEKVENFLLSYATAGTADEIAVISVKNPADAEAAADSLRTHLNNRKTLFRQYKPEEAARAEQGLVFTKDQYAVLIICAESQAVKSAFEAAVT